MREVIWFVIYAQAKSDAVRDRAINEIRKLNGLSYPEAVKYIDLILEIAGRIA